MDVFFFEKGHFIFVVGGVGDYCVLFILIDDANFERLSYVWEIRIVVRMHWDDGGGVDDCCFLKKNSEFFYEHWWRWCWRKMKKTIFFYFFFIL